MVTLGPLPGTLRGGFKSSFGLGTGDEHIDVMDAVAVAIAAVQELSSIVEKKDAEIQALKKQSAELAAEVEALRKQWRRWQPEYRRRPWHRQSAERGPMRYCIDP